MKKFLFPAWIVISMLWFLYSYTHVSLSLALNKSPFLFSIQQAFQYIGYFNRPLSVAIYVSLVLLTIILYIWTLRLLTQNKLNKKFIFKLIIAVSVIISLSYNAFSFDIFNYIFDAKIFTFYQQNPYLHKALDFPGDPMLSFMQWTHRTYPYGPVWLAVTIPFSYLGFQYFLPTFYLFKLISLAAYLATAWGIYKVVNLQKKEYALFAAAFFALNPLMILEFLVSGHNDIAMMALAIFSIYALIQRKTFKSLIIFLLSVGVKYATAFLFPLFLSLHFNPKRFERAVVIGIFSMILAIIAASLKSGSFQSWYFSYVFTIAALISYRKYVVVPVLTFSFFACLHYIPYLYTGNWDSPIPQILAAGQAVAILCSLLVCGYYLYKHFGKRSKV